MTTLRPINHNPFKYRYPVTAIVSIFHRISGVVLFLSIPLMLLIYKGANGSFAQFQQTLMMMSSSGARLLTWVILVAVAYHVLAGLRHLIMDAGFAESLPAAKASSWLVMIVGLLVAVGLGIWLW